MAYATLSTRPIAFGPFPVTSPAGLFGSGIRPAGSSGSYAILPWGRPTPLGLPTAAGSGTLASPSPQVAPPNKTGITTIIPGSYHLTIASNRVTPIGTPQPVHTGTSIMAPGAGTMAGTPPSPGVAASTAGMGLGNVLSGIPVGMILLILVAGGAVYFLFLRGGKGRR